MKSGNTSPSGATPSITANNTASMSTNNTAVASQQNTTIGHYILGTDAFLMF